MGTPRRPDPSLSVHPDPNAHAEAYFLSGRNAHADELAIAGRVFLEFVKGFSILGELGNCVTVFGSARFLEGHRYYEQARRLGQRLAELLAAGG